MQQTPQPQYRQPYDPQRAAAERLEAAIAVTRRLSRSAERSKSLWMLFTIGAAVITFLGLVGISPLVFLLGVMLFIGGMIGYGAASRRVHAAELEEAKLRAFNPWPS
ncbi:hypothetical protein RBS60_00570 [Sinomonas sp. ASV486]|uniref:hypothetical protein n=1 Tax=Sinomonas sp. ASV486 TaxID=3051170 RepID=UPI0027DD8DF1|nr:hypothetical protein [Sinomonas sp. ASV486]MDQ4488683.1 hypothetical protein [Sinomonas sp. ASV486]